MKKSILTLLSVIILLFFLNNKSYPLIYYVSASGNDLNTGLTQSNPWKTINKVNLMMPLFLPGDQILFKRGDSFQGSVVVTKSGSAGNLITFGSYGSGNLPVITGKKIIIGWTLYSGNIYRASISDTITSLYINSKLLTIARYPNSGFLRTDLGTGNTGFYDGALTQATGYWNGANCRIRTINWSYETKVVSNFVGGNVTFSTPTVYSNYTNYGYYFDNKLTLLDVPGEWYYDKLSRYVYLYAPGGVNPNTLVIEGVITKTGFKCNVPTNYTKIQDLKISGYTEYGIDYYTGHNNIIQGCYINHTGIFGLRINGSNNTIDNNIFEDNLNTAVMAVITNGLIKNNKINRTGLIAGYGVNAWGYIAMQLNAATGTTIELNNIDSSGYNAISIAKNNIVKNNIIDYSCIVLNDGGGIDITNCDSLRILNNIISNTIGNYETSGISGSYSCGIYVNGALMKNSTIQGNTVSYGRFVGILVDHKNTPLNNKIIGNTLYNNFYSQIVFTDYSAAIFVNSYNTIVKGNIFYSLSSAQHCMEHRAHTASGFSDYGIFDSNYYCNPYSEYVIRKKRFLPPYASTVYTLPTWKTSFGEDLNSKSLPFSFDQYKVTDTLSSNLITNSGFATNIGNWQPWPIGCTIAHTTHPLLNAGSMRIRWNGNGYSQGFTLSNTYPITKGSYYLTSISCVGNHSGTFNLWGRSSISSSLETFPQKFLTYANYRKDYSFTYKADTTDPGAHLSVGLILPDSLLYVDNVHMYHVNVQKIDSTQKSKLFINGNNFVNTISLGGIMYKDLNGNPVTGSITLQPYTSRILINDNTTPAYNLQLKVLVEGFYNVNSNSTIKDTVRVYLRSFSSPYSIVDSSKSFVDSNGNCTFNFTRISNSTNYFLVVKHRNSIETWSNTAVSFSSNFLSYDFTTAANKAYGNNLKLKGSKYCIYSGDINQEGVVDISDLAMTDNGVYHFWAGYRKEDMDGNNIIDLADLSIVDNNASKYVVIKRP